MTKVYIACPYSKGDVGRNVWRAIIIQDSLRRDGFVPYNPLLTHFWHIVCPHDYQFWLDYDKEWLRVCDVVLRVDGESSGADQEVSLARELGIPVVYSTNELRLRYGKWEMG